MSESRAPGSSACRIVLEICSIPPWGTHTKELVTSWGLLALCKQGDSRERCNVSNAVLMETDLQGERKDQGEHSGIFYAFHPGCLLEGMVVDPSAVPPDPIPSLQNWPCPLIPNFLLLTQVSLHNFVFHHHPHSLSTRVFSHSVGFLTFKLFLWSFFPTNVYLSNISLSFLKRGCQHRTAVIAPLQFVSVTLLRHSRIVLALLGSHLLCWTCHQNPHAPFHAMVLSYNPSCCKCDFSSGFLHTHLKTGCGCSSPWTVWSVKILTAPSKGTPSSSFTTPHNQPPNWQMTHCCVRLDLPQRQERELKRWLWKRTTLQDDFWPPFWRLLCTHLICTPLTLWVCYRHGNSQLLGH